jgi:hypothetical protein
MLYRRKGLVKKCNFSMKTISPEVLAELGIFPYGVG